MRHFSQIADLYAACGLPAPEHPMLSIFEFDTPTTAFSDHLDAFTGDFYIIGFKKVRKGLMLYGRTKYDHANGTMSFVKPGQVIETKHVEFEESGFVICFHADYVRGHFLHAEIRNYGFFEYAANEALHLSPAEEETMWGLFRAIAAEYGNNPDTFSRPIMLTHIAAILQYAQRFYRRQFINRTDVATDLTTRFHGQLRALFESGQLESDGLPKVRALAEALNLSPRYLSDLLKHETGKTAIEHIHIFLIDEARNLLLGPDARISETAYKLGFGHVTYFSRLFRKVSGLSPTEYLDRHSTRN